jgi:hypothetical protein
MAADGSQMGDTCITSEQRVRFITEYAARGIRPHRHHQRSPRRKPRVPRQCRRLRRQRQPKHLGQGRESQERLATNKCKDLKHVPPKSKATGAPCRRDSILGDRTGFSKNHAEQRGLVIISYVPCRADLRSGPKRLCMSSLQGNPALTRSPGLAIFVPFPTYEAQSGTLANPGGKSRD